MFLLAGLFHPASLALAQEETGGSPGSLILEPVDASAFPSMRLSLDAYDAQGNFLNDLQATDIQIREDGQSLRPQGFLKTTNGLQIILVLNTSPALANQREGISAYQRIQNTLLEWAKAQPADTKDDYSLATPTGLLVTRERNPKQLVKAIGDYQPDLRTAQPTLSSLAEAFDLATDPIGQGASKRVILYITPPMPTSTAPALADLLKRAQGIGARIHVWEVGGAESTPPTALQQLAQVSGGQYQALSASGQAPEIEPLFQSLRSRYQIQYDTTLQTGGTHTIQVSVQRPDGALESNVSSFSLTVQAPNPIFLSPPEAIQRNWDSSASQNQPALQAMQVPLQIVIEFPDQHPRPLKVTRLYVNGKLTEENTQAPFDRFTWTLSTDDSTRQMLRVEAVDTLGMVGTSLEVPVDMKVSIPPQTSGLKTVSKQGLIAIGGVVATGALLAVVMIFTSSRRKTRKRRVDMRRLMKDPVTQPVIIPQDHARLRKKVKIPRKQAAAPPNPIAAQPGNSWTSPMWPRMAGQNAPARLIALDETEQPITGGIIPLTRQEITFGGDPRRATQVINSPTISELHARLYRTEEGQFYLADQNSTAGTWVNYAPVTTNGARLEHGDLIHIGKVMFRFELTDPSQVAPRTVLVTPVDKML